MNTILGFKNLEEEDLEDNPCPENLREKMVEFHDSLMQVMSISSLEEEDVEIEPKSDEKPSILSVIFKVINQLIYRQSPIFSSITKTSF